MRLTREVRDAAIFVHTLQIYLLTETSFRKHIRTTPISQREFNLTQNKTAIERIKSSEARNIDSLAKKKQKAILLDA